MMSYLFTFESFWKASSTQHALSISKQLSMSVNMSLDISRIEWSSSTCKTRITLFLFAAAKSVATMATAFWLRVCISHTPPQAETVGVYGSYESIILNTSRIDKKQRTKLVRQ